MHFSLTKTRLITEGYAYPGSNSSQFNPHNEQLSKSEESTKNRQEVVNPTFRGSRLNSLSLAKLMSFYEERLKDTVNDFNGSRHPENTTNTARTGKIRNSTGLLDLTASFTRIKGGM